MPPDPLSTLWSRKLFTTGACCGGNASKQCGCFQGQAMMSPVYIMACVAVEADGSVLPDPLAF